MTPLRLYNLTKFTVSIGVSMTPIQIPFTNIFELRPSCSAEHSNKIRIGVFNRSHFIMG